MPLNSFFLFIVEHDSAKDLQIIVNIKVGLQKC